MIIDIEGVGINPAEVQTVESAGENGCWVYLANRTVGVPLCAGDVIERLNAAGEIKPLTRAVRQLRLDSRRAGRDA